MGKCISKLGFANMKKITGITSIVQLYEMLPDHERLITDILRQIIKENLPEGYMEKLSFNVPFFYGRRGICIVWPASVPRGGISEGVLLGFWHGRKLKDEDQYLTRGTNRQVYYKIYRSPEDIDEVAIKKLLIEAIKVDSI
jgi:hypothetical protein